MIIEKSVEDKQKAAMGNMICAIADTTEINIETTYGTSSNWIVIYGNATFEVLKIRDSRGELTEVQDIYNVNAENRQDGFVLPVSASIIKLSAGSIDVF